MDILAQIEKQYGCVAEYNRSREEDENEKAWRKLSNTEKKKIISESERRRLQYLEEIRLLKKEPNPIVFELKQKLQQERKVLQSMNDMKRFYESTKIYAKWIKSAAEEVTRMHGKETTDEVSRDKLEQDKFGITIEYTESCGYKHIYVNNLELKEFLDLYNDLYELGCSISFTYRDTKKRKPGWFRDDLHTLSHLSTTEIRHHELRYLGIKDEEAEAILEQYRKNYEF